MTATVAASDRFVVLHSAIGKWRRGDVVPADELGDITRLVGMKAIRPAYYHEQSQSHLALPDAPGELSWQQKLAERDDAVAALRAEVSELTRKLQAANPPVALTNNAAMEQTQSLLRQKEGMITELQSQLRRAELAAGGQSAIVRENEDLKQKLADMQARLEALQGGGSADEIRARIQAIADQGKTPPEPPARKKNG